jgi:hypothetical protein
MPMFASPSARPSEPVKCCGDPSNRDGGAHPWKCVGEDNRGIHYVCPVCGAEDSD